MNLREQPLDPARCWVRYAWRPWPGRDALWADLFTRGLGSPMATGRELDPALHPGPIDDVVYLPPVPQSLAEARRTLARRLAADGTPCLVQSLPAETTLDDEPGTEIFDVLQAVATGDLAVLEKVPRKARILWPLVSGYTDDPAVWSAGLGILARRGAISVQGVALELSPAERRRVVEVAGERGFEALFHGEPPAERSFAAAVVREGLQACLERPLPKAPARLRHNRRLAGVLAAAGDLWLRLERGEPQGLAFYRSARWIDRETHDLEALAREGNLAVVSWLDEASRRVVEEVASTGESALVAELRREYAGSG